MSDGQEKYWFNLVSKEVEYGLLSPSVDRAGPFDSAEEAAQAPEIIRKRSQAWADEDEADDNWGGSSAQKKDGE